MSTRRLEPLRDSEGKRKHPGIFRRHAAGCTRPSRCQCAYVVVWEHRGRQHKESHPTLALALEAQGKRRAGDTRPAERITFGSYYSGWIENYAGRTARGLQDSTRKEYRRSMNAHPLPEWESLLLRDIGPIDVRELFGKMARAGATRSQIVKVKAPLSAMFATAVEDGKVPSNPVSGVRIPAIASDAKPEEDKAKALSRKDLLLLLVEIERRSGEDWRLFFDFLWQTGLRIGEAIGLRWEHLDLDSDRGTVRVREQVYEGERKKLKSSNGKRDIPLSPGTTRRLREKRARLTDENPTAPVFASRTETELRPANVYGRVLAPAAIAVGLSEEAINDAGDTYIKSAVSFHTFRHTCASFLFSRDRNIKQVCDWLGHADPAFTLRTYVHLIDDGLGDADFFDSALTTDEGHGTPAALAA